MIPILFDAVTTSWNTNGIGRLDAISCTVREELNGLFELDMEYPTDGPRFSDLAVSNIILAQPYDGASPQPFRIYKVGKAMNGRVAVSARHLSYQLNWIPVMPFSYSSLADCLSKLRSMAVYTNPFTFWTDKTVIVGGAFTEPLPCRAMLGGVQGSILQRYGGEYEWDGYTVRLLSRRGSDNGVRIAYGKNLVDAQQETNIESTYTGVCPYYKDDNATVTLPEKYILASTAEDFPFLRIQTVDFSGDFQEPPTIAELRARTEQYITANRIGHPNVSIDVNFVALWQTEEYKDIAPLERVQLGDGVTVHFEKLGIDEQARVVAYDYDVIRERYNKITIGDLRSNFAQTFVDQGKALEQKIDTTAAKITSYTDDIVQKNTDWLTNGQGYVMAVKNDDGSWKELLFMDAPSVATARKVLRINENGLGFSDQGVGGPYAQAWTLDGSLSLGGLNNAYGKLNILSEDGSKIIDLDKSGLSLYGNNGKTIAQMAHSGVFYNHYDSGGRVDAFIYISGGTVVAQETASHAAMAMSPGQIDVWDEYGEGATLTGTELSAQNVLARNVTADRVDAGLVDVGNLSIGGSNGISYQLNIGNTTLYFVQGILTAVEAGGDSGIEGITDIITIDPEHEVTLWVESGIITDYEENPW